MYCTCDLCGIGSVHCLACKVHSFTIPLYLLQHEAQMEFAIISFAAHIGVGLLVLYGVFKLRRCEHACKSKQAWIRFSAYAGLTQHRIVYHTVLLAGQR